MLQEQIRVIAVRITFVRLAEDARKKCINSLRKCNYLEKTSSMFLNLHFNYNYLLPEGLPFYSMYLRCFIVILERRTSNHGLIGGKKVLDLRRKYTVFKRQSEFFGDFRFLIKLSLRQRQTDGLKALAFRISFYNLVPPHGKLVVCLFTVFVLLCPSSLILLGWKKPNSFALTCRKANFPVKKDIALSSEKKVNQYLCPSGSPN